MSGDHRIDGLLAASGPALDRASFPETARLVDLAPTILAAVGAPASVRHSGSPLASIVGQGAATAASVEAPAIEDGSQAGLDDAEAEEVEEHLRGLGYLE